jgi:hypothetical protein
MNRIVILGLALVVALAAQLVQVHVPPPHPVGAAPTYIVDEDCEGVGTPSNWTDTGSPDWDSTVVVLEGSESNQQDVEHPTPERRRGKRLVGGSERPSTENHPR